MTKEITALRIQVKDLKGEMWVLRDYVRKMNGRLARLEKKNQLMSDPKEFDKILQRANKRQQKTVIA